MSTSIEREMSKELEKSCSTKMGIVVLDCGNENVGIAFGATFTAARTIYELSRDMDHVDFRLGKEYDLTKWGEASVVFSPIILDGEYKAWNGEGKPKIHFGNMIKFLSENPDNDENAYGEERSILSGGMIYSDFTDVETSDGNARLLSCGVNARKLCWEIMNALIRLDEDMHEYDTYRYAWLESHVDAGTFLEAVENFRPEKKETFAEMIEEKGFGGEIWASNSEWERNEKAEGIFQEPESEFFKWFAESLPFDEFLDLCNHYAMNHQDKENDNFFSWLSNERGFILQKEEGKFFDASSQISSEISANFKP